MKGKLEILVGPIASGKSTYCEQKAKDGAIIVNDDAIVTALHGGNYTLYSEDLKPLYKLAENVVVHGALTMGKLVIIDRPNHRASMRRRYIGLAKSLDLPVTIVMFKRESPLVHAKRRFFSNHRNLSLQHWEKTCKIHETLYEPPDADREGFDEIVEVGDVRSMG